MPKIGQLDLGQPVHEYLQQQDSMRYHHPGTGVTAEVKRRLPSPGNPDGLLCDLKLISHDSAQRLQGIVRTSVRWKNCDPSVKADLKKRSRMDSPPPTPPLSHAVASNGRPPVDPIFAASPGNRAGLNAYNVHDPRILSFKGHPAVIVETLEELRIAEHGPAGQLNDDQRARIAKVVAKIAGPVNANQQHLLIAAHYLRRLPASVRAKLAPVELIAGCIRLAHNYTNDSQYSPSAWETWTRIPKERLLMIEREILTGLGHNLSFGDIGPEPAPDSSATTDDMRVD